MTTYDVTTCEGGSHGEVVTRKGADNLACDYVDYLDARFPTNPQACVGVYREGGHGGHGGHAPAAAAEPYWGQKLYRPHVVRPAYLTGEQLAASRAACGVRPLVRA